MNRSSSIILKINTAQRVSCPGGGLRCWSASRLNMYLYFVNSDWWMADETGSFGLDSAALEALKNQLLQPSCKCVDGLSDCLATNWSVQKGSMQQWLTLFNLASIIQTSLFKKILHHCNQISLYYLYFLSISSIINPDLLIPHHSLVVGIL